MALSKLGGDEQCLIFSQLCNTLDPIIAMAFSSASSELQALTQPLQQQLKADYEAATALARKLGWNFKSCKDLRKAMVISSVRSIYYSSHWTYDGLTAADLELLGTLVLPALGSLHLREPAAGPDGVQRLAEKLCAGALPALTILEFSSMQVGDAGASALAAALGRGAIPRLKSLNLILSSIGDAGLVALAPALQKLPALEHLYLASNPLGDEGLAALLAPPPAAGAPPAGALPPTTGVLTKLKVLNLRCTQIADAGCAALAAAFDSGALPPLEDIDLLGTQATGKATRKVNVAITQALTRRMSPPESRFRREGPGGFLTMTF